MESVLGLASSGVYRAVVITNNAVRSYRTFSPLLHKAAVYFLWHFPSAHAAQMLSGAMSCEARTFLCTKCTATVWPTRGKYRRLN